MHDVVDRALQAHGSLGYSTDLPLEQMYRFARAARLYDGPDEVHRQSVARQILRGYEAPEDGVPTEHVPTRREAAARALRAPARGRHLQRLRVVLLASLLGRAARARGCGGASDDPAAAPTRAEGRPLRRPRARSPSCAARSSSARARRARRVLRQLAVRLRDALPRGRFEAVPGTGPAQRRRPLPGTQAGGRGRRALRHEGAAGLRRRQRRRGRHRGGARARARAAPHQAPARARPSCASCCSTARRRPTTTATSTPPACAARRPTRAATPTSCGALVLLDFVADKDLRIPREAGLGPGAVGAPARAPRRRVGARRDVPGRASRRDHRRPHAVHARAASRRST